MIVDGLIYICIGLFAGLMAGLLGIGGGVIVVPGLMFIFQHNELIPYEFSMQMAAGSSLAVMILTSQSSLRAHLKLGGVLWPIFGKLWPGLLVGTIFGALLAHEIPTLWLKTLFSLFLVLVAIKMYLDVHVTHPSRFPSILVNHGINFGIGLNSGLLGLGGGILIVPYLTYCGLDTRKIAAITNLCTLVVGLVGTLMFMITGLLFMPAIPYSIGYVYWPAVLFVAIPSALLAPYGARLNYILPMRQIKYGFVLILLITAVSLFLKR